MERTALTMLNPATTPHESATDPQTKYSPPRKSAKRVTFWDRWIARLLLRAVGNPPVAIELWNGERIVTSSANQVVTGIQLADRRTLLSLLWNPSLGFGEAWMDGRLNVSGSLTELCETIHRNRSIPNRSPRHRTNTVRRSHHNASHHYDIGNDFYRLWLDPQMVYTCAYYPDSQISLAAAQEAKFELVCRKLRLKPGQTVVEAGCGWGGLARYMASRYDVSVTAYNVSAQQVAYARQQAREQRLDGQVEFIEDDWRNMTGQFDTFVSVGMLEHVGIENYAQLGDTIHQVLKPNGLGLIHSIGLNIARPFDVWARRYIFPGAQPPSLSQMMTIFEEHEFSILDVENLRLHYARTLEDWQVNFEEHVEEVRQLFDERFVRMWQLYLASSIAAFRSGKLQLFQAVFAHTQNNRVPWTRADILLADGPSVSTPKRPR